MKVNVAHESDSNTDWHIESKSSLTYGIQGHPLKNLMESESGSECKSGKTMSKSFLTYGIQGHPLKDLVEVNIDLFLHL